MEVTLLPSSSSADSLTYKIASPITCRNIIYQQKNVSSNVFGTELGKFHSQRH